jgi:F0F1-type ATP synthase assembly protein I
MGWRVMAKKQSGFPYARSAQSLQENVKRSGSAAGAAYTLIGAIVLLGAVGYGVDYWQGTTPWGLLVGLLVGMAVGFYELAKTVWSR